MIHEIIASLLLATSCGTPLIRTTPLKANLSKISGIYNFRNSVDTTYLEKYRQSGAVTEYIYFDTSNITDKTMYIDPIRIDNENYYLSYMQLGYSGLQSAVYIRMYYYDDEGTIDEFNVTYYESANIEYIASEMQDMYFYVRESILLDEMQSDLFKAVFTLDENEFTKNYSGYYQFNNYLASGNYNYNMYGNVTIGQRMYYNSNLLTNKVVTNTYNSQNGIYENYDIMLPFTNSGTPGQWYLNVKMTEEDYTNWQRVGNFGYIPQVTPGEYTFSDLFFDLADTPIYFVYSIFNWELFGANLFLAFIGLTSFALILVLFRKFL